VTKWRSSQWTFYGIPLVLFGVVLALVVTGEVLERFPRDRNVPVRLQEVSNAAAAGHWPEIRQAVQRLESDWQAVRKRLRLAISQPNLDQFDLEMAALRGAVEGEDLIQVQIIQQRLTALWEGMGL